MIFAVGRAGQLQWPEWAEKLKNRGASVNHVYSKKFDTDDIPNGSQITILGGGQSGAQLALDLSKTHPGKITIITRTPLKKNYYDVPPGWMGPKYLHHFYHEPGYKIRRQMINEARNSGTMTPEIYRDLTKAIANKKIHHIIGEIDNAILFSSNLIKIDFKNGESVAVTVLF